MKKLIIICLLLNLFSCKKEINKEKSLITNTEVEFLNTTDYENGNYNMYKDGQSMGIWFGCNPSAWNKIEVGHIYVITGTDLITSDTIGIITLNNQGEFNIYNNPNVTYAQLRYTYTCNGKGIKIWD